MRAIGRPIAVLLAVAVVTAGCGGGRDQATGGGAANACGTPVNSPCGEEAQALNGAGATFPAVIYTKWIDEYNKRTGVPVS